MKLSILQGMFFPLLVFGELKSSQYEGGNTVNLIPKYNSQYLRCTELDSASNEESITVPTSIGDLNTMGWNDRISSCCFNGIWILYEDTLYNQDNENVSHILYL
jgi:hypothetical protein